MGNRYHGFPVSVCLDFQLFRNKTTKRRNILTIMPTDKYGSARWAQESDFQQEGILRFPAFQPNTPMLSSPQRKEFLKSNPVNRSFILGRLGDPATLTEGIRKGYDTNMGLFGGLSSLFTGGRGGQYLGWAGDGHILTVAPTRSGKGVGLVIPNLTHYPGSVIVIDPKGENYAVTHKFRRDFLKQQIVCLDPFRIMSKGMDCINPFEGIVDYNKSPERYHILNPELLDEANLIAEALIMRGPEEKDPHWNDKCRTLLKGIILSVICGLSPNGRRHLSEVRAIIASGEENLKAHLVLMEKKSTLAGGLVSRAAKEIQSMGTQELKNVISFALKHTEFLDSPLVEEALGDSEDKGTFNMRNLKTKGGVSVYMILPPHYLTRYVRVLRLWVTMAMAAMTRTKDKPADGCPVLFMLDEMAQLGTLDMMRQAVSLLAGYGMSIWMIWQDLSQLKMLYEHDWPSFIANAKIQQFFGINDHETAKFVSEMLGAATIDVETTAKGTSGGRFAIMDTQSNKSTTHSETQRNLLNADEIRRLNRKSMLMFVQGIPPILAERITYYEDQTFTSRCQTNPYV